MLTHKKPTPRITLIGKTFIHKYLYSNPLVLLKLRFIKVVDVWYNPISKKYAIRLHFVDKGI